MKTFLCLVISAALSVAVSAQRTDSKTGIVVGPDPQAVQTPLPDLATFDFKNFTYPAPGNGVPSKTFTLTDGIAPLKRFWLRKTYFFDLTRDAHNEAVAMVMSSDCTDGCDEKSVFFVYTADAAKPKLIFKLAFGEQMACGLKSINFAIGEITAEAFGDCVLADWQLVKSSKITKGLKPTTFTRFVFSRTRTEYTAEKPETLPLGNLDFAEYRPQISFGTEP